MATTTPQGSTSVKPILPSPGGLASASKGKVSPRRLRAFESGEAQHLAQPRRFAARLFDRLADFGDERLRERFGARIEQIGGAAQHRGARVGGGFAHLFRPATGGDKRALDIRRVRARDFADDFAVVGRAHFDDARFRVAPFAVDKHFHFSLPVILDSDSDSTPSSISIPARAQHARKHSPPRREYSSAGYLAGSCSASTTSQPR